jgi:putative transposase
MRPDPSGPAPDHVGEDLIIHRRRLPHWQIGGLTYFVTFHLRAAEARVGAPRPLSAPERAIVRDSLLFWHRSRWTLHALTVMPDHVHLLATPLQSAPGEWHSLPQVVRGAKSYSASRINRGRGEKGALWQHEGYDRIVRSDREFDQKLTYLLENAHQAGLVADLWDWDGLWYEGRDG